jgi:hypothetical protein
MSRRKASQERTTLVALVPFSAKARLLSTVTFAAEAINLVKNGASLCINEKRQTLQTGAIGKIETMDA